MPRRVLSEVALAGLEPEIALARLNGFLEQNDEWAVQRSRYMTLESVAPTRR